MDYTQTINLLYQMLPMYQNIGASAYKKDLSNTKKILNHLENPHLDFKSVHIAGTNGKGTCAHSIAAICQTAGYKTGLLTSPHLKRFTERIKINGIEINEQFVIEFIEKNLKTIKKIKPSFFEITVAMAFFYFSKSKIDIGIIETGLGGKLDSTNILNPEISLITNIGLDHTDLLGNTLEKIAVEKAGIIKEKTTIVIGEYQKEIHHIFEEQSKKLNAPLICSKIEDPLPSKKFTYNIKKNLNAIINTVEALRKKGWKISDTNIVEGLQNVGELTNLTGRFHKISDNPLIIADVAHNAEGLNLLFNETKKLHAKHLHLIYGTVNNKPLEKIFKIIPRNATCYWTQPSIPRALPVNELQHQAHLHDLKGNIFLNAHLALKQALLNAKKEDLILITGSTFVVGEII